MNEGAGMGMAEAGARQRQFLIAALASLAWNVFGCLDFILIQIRDPGYIGSLPPETMPWVDAFPYWATAAWGLGAGASLAGSLLLLMRRRYAALAFLASFVLAAVAMGYWHLSGDMPASLDTAWRRLFDLFLLAVIALQAWYAWRRTQR